MKDSDMFQINVGYVIAEIYFKIHEKKNSTGFFSVALKF